MTNDNLEYYRDAYEIGPERRSSTPTPQLQHVDQGLKPHAVFPGHGHHPRCQPRSNLRVAQGHQTLYIRLRQAALTGTGRGCVSRPSVSLVAVDCLPMTAVGARGHESSWPPTIVLKER